MLISFTGGKFDTESEDNTNIDKSENIRPDRPEAQKTTFLQIMASPGILAGMCELVTNMIIDTCVSANMLEKNLVVKENFLCPTTLTW